MILKALKNCILVVVTDIMFIFLEHLLNIIIILTYSHYRYVIVIYLYIYSFIYAHTHTRIIPALLSIYSFIQADTFPVCTL